MGLRSVSVTALGRCVVAWRGGLAVANGSHWCGRQHGVSEGFCSPTWCRQPIVGSDSATRRFGCVTHVPCMSIDGRGVYSRPFIHPLATAASSSILAAGGRSRQWNEGPHSHVSHSLAMCHARPHRTSRFRSCLSQVAPSLQLAAHDSYAIERVFRPPDKYLQPNKLPRQAPQTPILSAIRAQLNSPHVP